MTCNPGERAITAGLEGDGAVFMPNTFDADGEFPADDAHTVGDVPTGWYVEARNTAVCGGPVPRVPGLRTAVSARRSDGLYGVTSTRTLRECPVAQS